MPADQGPPLYQVLAALVVSLRSELAQARAELERARERIAELEARLRQTPRNSSKPPSSAGLAKLAPRSLRKKSGRRPGGQDGHKGQTLTQVARPDREVWHEPGGCGWCGAALPGRPVTGVERRQVFDLPPVRAEVTGHQLIERECACGHRTRAAAPEGAEAPVQYGPRIVAVIVCLYIGQFLSKKRTAQALAELAGRNPQGYVSMTSMQFHRRLRDGPKGGLSAVLLGVAERNPPIWRSRPSESKWSQCSRTRTGSCSVSHSQ
jgi:transposase